jgi:hypothetical protein
MLKEDKYFTQYVENYQPIPKDDENYTKCFYANQGEEIQQFFWEFGFAVVRDVLSVEEVNGMQLHSNRLICSQTSHAGRRLVDRA